MKRDKMVLVTFRIARYSEELETDPNAELEYGPCTEEEGKVLCEIINTRRWNSPRELLNKLPGITPNLRSYIRDARGYHAQVVPAFRYLSSVSRVIDLLGRETNQTR